METVVARKKMMDWNVLAIVHQGRFSEAIKILKEFGPVQRSRFYNVLELKVANTKELLERMRLKFEENPGMRSIFSRILPVEMAFAFSTKEEFEKKAAESVKAFLNDLRGKSFHVRIHRRGFKERLSSPEEERSLDRLLIEELEKAGSPGRIDFDDPDAILAVETLGNRAGLALWRREDRALCPFFRIE
ncbi:MAG: THUMP domain-containing protein [Nitrospiraceae bacterium]|nr:THUMP domain-containing protein [Nitrospiraceae bacterium]